MRDFTVASENIARAVHNGLLADTHPTFDHVNRVVTLLKELIPNASDELVAATWLHDTLKYTRTSFHEIRLLTTVRVAQICQLVTDPGVIIITGTEPREPRDVVKRRLYDNFRNETNHSIRRDAAIVRLVDRIENMRSATGARVEIYINEFADYFDVYNCDEIHDNLYDVTPLLDAYQECYAILKDKARWTIIET